MLLGCTKKLADTMKIKLPTDNPVPINHLYSWHATLFVFGRRKGVLLMNDKTRYCVVLYGMKAEHFKRFDSIVMAAIEETFLAEGLAPDVVERYISRCGEVVFTKIYDRSILGQINDMLLHLSWKIDNDIPDDNVSRVEMSKYLGRIILGQRANYRYAVELLLAEMANQ